jgi:hypothetical protein
MIPSMPRFENKDSLDRFLGNMKLQIFNAEFAALCKVSQDSMQQLFEDSNTAYDKSEKTEKNGKLAQTNPSPKLIDPKKPEEIHKIVNPRSVLTKRKNSDIDIEKEILPHSEIKIKKHEAMPLLAKPEEPPKEFPVPIPGMYSEEAKTNTENLIRSPTQTPNLVSPKKSMNQNNFPVRNPVINSSETQTGSPKNPEDMPLRTMDGKAINEQSFNGPVKPKFIQPIYIYYSENQVGYIEVDVMDEEAMRNVSMLLAQNQPPQLNNYIPPHLNDFPPPSQLNNNNFSPQQQFNNNFAPPQPNHNFAPPQLNHNFAPPQLNNNNFPPQSQ